MSENVKHPLPWRVELLKGYFGDMPCAWWAVRDAQNDVVMRVPEDSPELADRTCRAVNSHAALLTACKESSGILEAVATALESGLPFNRAKCVADLRRVADMNDAAITAAEPEVN